MNCKNLFTQFPLDELGKYIFHAVL
jgi:hypothetical protein